MRQLAVVKLTHDIESPKRIKKWKFPKGEIGTIIHAFLDGEHYLVEFPNQLVRLTLEDIEPA